MTKDQAAEMFADEIKNKFAEGKFKGIVIVLEGDRFYSRWININNGAAWDLLQQVKDWIKINLLK